MKPHQSKISQSKIGPGKIAIIGLGYVGLPPIDEFKQPDLNPLQSACRTVGAALKQDDVVIFDLKYLFDQQLTDVRL